MRTDSHLEKNVILYFRMKRRGHWLNIDASIIRNDVFRVQYDFFFFKRKTPWLAGVHRQEMLSRSKLSQKQAHVDRVFGTGITSYQIPTSQFAQWFAHYTVVKCRRNTFCSFSRSTYFFPFSLSHQTWFISLILKSSVLEGNRIIPSDDRTFLRFDGRERERKLLNLRVTEQSDWPFHFEKLLTADTCSWETTWGSLTSCALREWDSTCPYVRIPSYLLIREAAYREKKKKRDQFSWKNRLRNTSISRFLSLGFGAEFEAETKNVYVEYDRIVGIVYR